METLAQKLGLSDSLLEAAKKVMKGKTEVEINPDRELDKPGKEDEDINNDGKVDDSDSYLKNRRKKIKAAMKEEEECPTCVDGACQCAVEEGVMGENPLSREAQEKKKTIMGKIKQKFKQKYSNNPFEREPSKKPRIKNPLAREEVEENEEVEQIDEISADLAKRYLKAQDKEMTIPGKVENEGRRKTLNRLDGYSRAKKAIAKSEKTTKVTESSEKENIDKVNAIAKELKDMATKKEKPKLPHVNDGAPDMFKVKEEVKLSPEEISRIEEIAKCL